MSVILLHDGSFEGFCTAVFEAYLRRPSPDRIDETGCQQEFGGVYVEIPCDDAKAERVINGILRRAGSLAYEKIWTAFLSDDPEKSQALYEYIRLVMEQGSRTSAMLYDERVRRVEKLANLVGREAGLLLEFIRFSRLEGGVWYARIDPEYPVLPIITPHFADRFNIQPFLIHDVPHGQIAVYDTRSWRILSDFDLTLPAPAPEERDFRHLWKVFYDAIAIRQKINPRLRMNHMPKKYWRNLTELQPEPAGFPAENKTAPSPLPEQTGKALP
ncbi:MAG: TIGR03915 family putative DNA repair protein [Firmicutes bacterium]|nr:TIGR03915 family putative DNA repair protein [Bacillota bacterium]